ncbi:MAG TPA: glycosyltransferase [Pirellulales bacterium]|nr:glycosyltransferase [Pirellulales bacterium]
MTNPTAHIDAAGASSGRSDGRALPRILLNTTTLRIGGALQTSTAFIIEALRHPGQIDWAFALSRSCAKELEQFGVALPKGTEIFDKPPTFSLAERRRLLEFEAAVKPDMVFTFSGPAYARFRNPHLVGCSTGWVTHSTWTAYRSLGSIKAYFLYAIRFIYKWFWFRRATDWVVQTETARRGLAHRLRLPLDRITVILNTCGERYLQNQGARPFPAPSPDQPLRILCFSAAHKHKNLEILPELAKELAARRPDLNFRVVLTLPEQNWLTKEVMARAERLGVTHLLENRGWIPVAQGPDLYRSCDISFLPTLLETFSANYPEAMAMGLPIVTTDLGFAHDVCDDAALYYQPCNARSAADCILRLLDDKKLWERQIARGKEILTRYPTPHQRYQQYIRLLLAICQREGHPMAGSLQSAQPVPQR